jgi:hypothetical protein
LHSLLQAQSKNRAIKPGIQSKFEFDSKMPDAEKRDFTKFKPHERRRNQHRETHEKDGMGRRNQYEEAHDKDGMGRRNQYKQAHDNDGMERHNRYEEASHTVLVVRSFMLIMTSFVWLKFSKIMLLCIRYF